MTLAWWTLRARSPELAARQAPLVLAILFLVSQFATVVPWGRWAAALADAPLGRGLLAAALVAGAGRVAGPLDVDAPFRRHLPPWRVGPILLPVLLSAAGPALAAAWLYPGGGPLPRLVGWSAAAGWYGRGHHLLPAAALVAGELLGPARLLLDLPLLLALGRAPLPVVPGAGGAWRPRTAFGALLGRDLRCLWRTEPRVWAAATFAALPCAGLVWGLRHNGGLDRDRLGAAAALLLCLVSPAAAAGLETLRVRLGRAFAPRAWPVPAALRVASLVAVFSLLLLPTHAAMAAVGGVGPATVPLPVVAMLGAGATWLATWSTLNLGVYGGWALLAAGLVLAGRAEWGLLLAAPAAWDAARRLG